MVREVFFQTGELGTDPFYRARLTFEQVESLRDALRDVARAGVWFELRADIAHPERMSVLPSPSNGHPRAGQRVLAEIIDIGADESGSCLIRVSPIGAEALVRCLERVLADMHRWVELLVARRENASLELWTDLDLEEAATAELESVNDASIRAWASQAPANEFADWPGSEA